MRQQTRPNQIKSIKSNQIKSNFKPSYAGMVVVGPRGDGLDARRKMMCSLQSAWKRSPMGVGKSEKKEYKTNHQLTKKSKNTTVRIS